MQPASALNIEDELSVFARGSPALTPAQSTVAAEVSSSLAAAEVAVLRVASGMGRTTVLQAIHAQTGGAFVIARQFLGLLSKRPPEAIEESLLELLEGALDRNDVVLVDDFHLLMEVMNADKYARADLANVVVTAILDDASRHGKEVVFGLSGDSEPDSVRSRAAIWEMADFEPEDYAQIASNYLGSAAARLDMDKVHRFAPALNAYQIKHACLWLGLRYAAPNTDSFIDYLRSRRFRAT